MTSNWEKVRLGDLVEASRRRTDPRLMDPTEKLVHYSIPVLDVAGFPETVQASTIQSHKFRIVRDSILVSMLNPRIPRVFKARGAINAVGSTEFAVLSPLAGEKLSLDFLHLICSDRRLWDYLESVATGSTGSRKRAKTQNLMDFHFDLPPVVEQRRIVDLIGALDNAIESAERSEEDLADLLSETAGALDCEEVKPLGNLATLRSGPSWKAADETSHPTKGSTPVLGITNTPRGMDLDLSSKKFVSGIPDKAMRLGTNSLIMIRTNGNRERIGSVYRSSSEVQGFAVSAFQIMIEPQSSEDASLIYWQLFSDSTQKSISEAASGSTGLGNIAVGWLKQMEIKYPSDRNSVTRYLGACEAVAKTCREAKSHADSLRTLRSELLTALLSGAHSIPESYDEVMSAV